MQSVSYLSNDLTCGLSPMDTSPEQPYLGGIVGMFAWTVMPESTKCAVRDGCLKEVHCVASLFRHWVMQMGDMLGWLGG